MPPSSSDNQPRFSRTKRLCYAWIPGATLLIALTGMLWLLERCNAMDTQRVDDRVAYLSNDIVKKETTSTGEQFRIVDAFMLQRAFPAEKTKQTFRLFCTGASFAMGHPYAYACEAKNATCTIPDWIQAELQLRYPSTHFEVINAAAEAQNSFRVSAVVEQLANADPDLILVMMGNNEGYVPITPFHVALHKWVLYRALTKILLPAPEPYERFYFAPQDPCTHQIENHFRSNVQKIIATSRKKGVSLVLATMPINLKYYPNDPNLDIPFPKNDPYMDQGNRLKEEAKYQEAIQQYLKSENKGFTAYPIAQCCEFLGRYDQANQYYKMYTQHLPLNRTRPSFNQFIRKACTDQGIVLVDLERALEKLSPNGIPDPALFVDYCHMTWKGYYLMAREVVRVLVENSVIPADKGEPKEPSDLASTYEKTSIQLQNWTPGRPPPPG